MLQTFALHPWQWRQVCQREMEQVCNRHEPGQTSLQGDYIGFILWNACRRASRLYTSSFAQSSHVSWTEGWARTPSQMLQRKSMWAESRRDDSHQGVGRQVASALLTAISMNMCIHIYIFIYIEIDISHIFAYKVSSCIYISIYIEVQVFYMAPRTAALVLVGLDWSPRLAWKTSSARAPSRDAGGAKAIVPSMYVCIYIYV